MDRIFVQIASYRDPQLRPTIDDAIKKASYPERVVFGICNQYSESDEWYAVEDFIGPNFRVKEVPYEESLGACWARSIVQGMWDGEEYTLQLDSHHQFSDGWDETLIDMYKRCPSDKPIITGYVPQCPVDGNEYCTELYEMLPHFELDNVILQFKPSIRKDAGLKRHMLWSGHFMFTEGVYCKNVPYDPELYFIGEEITMAVRSYTSGYDMFYPDKPVIWHEYGRAQRPKHWSDHTIDKCVDTSYFTLDSNSKRKVGDILHGREVDSCGIGTVRTIEDYENAAGLCFKKSYVSSEAMNFAEAPVFSDSSWRDIDYIKYEVSVDWSEYEEYLQEFKPDQIALFVRDSRKDFKISENMILCGEITGQWTNEPKFAEIWPYKCNPLEWGKKVTAKIVGCNAEKVS